MNYEYKVHWIVKARVGCLDLGECEIVALTHGNTPPVPMYKVKSKDGTYPIYEDEITEVVSKPKRGK